MSEEDKFYSCAETVVQSRPRARWRYDQVFMLDYSMAFQAQHFYHYLKNKNIVFLGDGDGAAIYYGLLLKEGLVENIKGIAVLDFDERILNYHSKIYNDNDLNQYYKLNLIKYNALNPVPSELKGQFDFFYINPPYGAFNNGNSIIAWIHRCLDLCNDKSMGCLVIPCDKNYDWSIRNYAHVKEFLINKGFKILEEMVDIHSYNFSGTSDLKSSTLIVKKVEHSTSEYSNCQLPQQYTETLYGKPRDIPNYIIDDDSEYGIEEF